jgi:hypothetical protein
MFVTFNNPRFKAHLGHTKFSLNVGVDPQGITTFRSLSHCRINRQIFSGVGLRQAAV